MPLFNTPPLSLPALDLAIDHHPITVAWDALITDVLSLMGQTGGGSNGFACSAMAKHGRTTEPIPKESIAGNYQQATPLDAGSEWDAKKSLDSSYVVVMQETGILGVFGEREAVELIASGKVSPDQKIADAIIPQPAITLTLSEGQDIFTPLFFFRQYRIRHLPIVDNDGQLLGIVTPQSILQAIQPVNLLKLSTVTEVMRTERVTAPQTASVLSVARLMAEHQVSCAIVTESSREFDSTPVPVGIITEQKILQAMALGLDLAQTPARTVMRRLGEQLNTHDSLLRAYQQMQSQQMQTLLVSGQPENGRVSVMGTIAQVDLLRSLEPSKIYKGFKRSQQLACQLQIEKTELLRSRNSELERLVQQRTAALQAALTQVEQQAQRASLINQIIQAVRNTMVLDEILQTIADQLHQTLKVSRCLIFRPDAANELAVSHVSQAASQRDRFIGMSCDSYRYYHSQLQSGDPVILPRIDSNLDPKIQASAQTCDIRALMLVPLVYRGLYIGVISLHQCDRERNWKSDEVAFVKSIAAHCAIAIHQGELHQQMQAELQQRKRLQQERDRFFNHSQDLMAIADFNGYLRLINPAWEKTLGFSQEELENKPFVVFVHPEDLEATYEVWQQVFETGQPVSGFLNRYLCKDGSYKWLSWQAVPFMEEGLIYIFAHDLTPIKQAETALQSLNEDLEIKIERRTAALKQLNQQLQIEIAERKQAETELQEVMRFQQAILDGANYSIISSTPDGTIRTFNAAAERMLGYTASEVIGKTTPSIIHNPEEVAQRAQDLSIELGYSIEPGFDVFVAQPRHGKTDEREWTYIRKDGSRFPVLLSVTALRDAQNNITGFLGIASDITQRKQVEERLRLTERAIAASNNGIIICDAKRRDNPAIYVNPAFERMTGYSADEVIGRNCRFLQGADKNQSELKLLRAAIREGRDCTVILRNYRKDGSLFWNELSIAPIYDRQGNLTHFIGVQTDISDRKQAEASLQQAKDQLQAVLDAVPGFVSWISSDLRYLGVNQHLANTYNLSPDTFVGQDIGFIQNSPHFAEFMRQFMVSPEPAASFIFDTKVNGYTRNYLIATQKYQQGTAAVSVGIDITERKQAEDKLKASLKEKQVLLKEIHHRVKNNLQIISSLLKLQSIYIKDEQALTLFTESYNRVRSMALIHEKLYQSEGLAEIDAYDYIRNLAHNLFSSYNVGERLIELNLNIDKIILDIDTSVPCGLIINELISNALKYAFIEETKKGEISIIFIASEPNKMTLIVSDNGVGLPPGFDIESTESLGLQLVYNLTEQLGGNIEVDCSSGTSIKITFYR